VDVKKFFPHYRSDETWERNWEQFHKDMYQNTIAYYSKKGITIPPWEEFSRGKFINCDEYDEVPYTGWDAQIKEGRPLRHKSGKIEFYNDFIANEANRGKGEHFDVFGQPYDNLRRIGRI
jgi:hypothetical protein